MKKNFSDENFKKVSTNSGECNLSVMGKDVKFDYNAKNYINNAGTIAYAEIEMKDASAGEKKTIYAFLSKLEKEDAITYSGSQGMLKPESKEGIRIATVDENKSVKEHYLAHLELLGKDNPIANRELLMDKIKDIPNTILEFEMQATNKAIGLIKNLGNMANLHLIKGETKNNKVKVATQGLDKSKRTTCKTNKAIVKSKKQK